MKPKYIIIGLLDGKSLKIPIQLVPLYMFDNLTTTLTYRGGEEDTYFVTKKCRLVLKAIANEDKYWTDGFSEIYLPFAYMQHVAHISYIELHYNKQKAKTIYVPQHCANVEFTNICQTTGICNNGDIVIEIKGESV